MMCSTCKSYANESFCWGGVRGASSGLARRLTDSVAGGGDLLPQARAEPDSCPRSRSCLCSPVGWEKQ